MNRSTIAIGPSKPIYAAPHNERGGGHVRPAKQEYDMITFETAASLLVGIAAQTLVIGLILVG